MSRDNAVGSPTRNSEVEQQVNALLRNGEELSKAVCSLEERLYQVLTATGPENTGVTAQTEPVRVPLAETLYNHNNGIANLTRRLQSILDRIEL